MALTEISKEKYKTYSIKELAHIFDEACENGDLNAMQYLIRSTPLNRATNLQELFNNCFFCACLYGNLDIVRYLLTSPDVTVHADIHEDNDHALIYACMNGHLDVVKYLLSSPDLVEHADIHAEFKTTIAKISTFGVACANTFFDIVQYLLSFDGTRRIDFQETEFHLGWAIENQYDDIVVAMMHNLQRNEPLMYIECLLNIEAYHPELYDYIKMSNILIEDVASSVPELYL